MTFSKSLFLGLGILALMGCSTQSNKTKNITQDSPGNFDKAPGTNFLVDALKVNSTTTAQFTSYGLPAKKMFNLEACIKDPSGAAVQVNLPFSIGDGSGNEINKSTDLRGCLTWSETHEFSYLADETYFKFRREINGKSIYKGAVYVQVAFDPWADGGGTVLDLRYNDVPENAKIKEIGKLSVKGAKAVTGQRPDLRVNLKSASFEFLGLDYGNYEISPFLGLTVAHKYRVKLSPSIIRKTLSKTTNPETLNTGRMKAYLVILKEDSNLTTQFDLKNVITTTELTGDMSYGDLMADVVVKFERVSDITSRTIGLVTLVPLDELQDLGEVSFVGSLKPGVLTGLNLIPASMNARELAVKFQQAKARQIKSTVKPAQLFAKTSGLKPMEMSTVRAFSFMGVMWEDVDMKAYSESFLNGILSEGDLGYFKQALCLKVYGQDPRLGSLAANCQNNPDFYIQFGKRSFVESLNSKVPRKVGLTTLESFSMASSISKTEAYATSKGYNDSLRAGLGLSLGLDLNASGLPGMKLGSIPYAPEDPNDHSSWVSGDVSPIKGSIGAKFSIGRDWFITRSKSSGTSQGTTATASRGFTVSAEGNSFEIDANTRNCVFAQPHTEHTKLLKVVREKLAGANLDGVYYCSSAVKREKRVETFYLVGQQVGNAGSPFSDSAANTETPWRMFMRGRASLALFAALVSNSDVELVLEKLPTNEFLSEFTEFYTSQEYPGLLAQ